MARRLIEEAAAPPVADGRGWVVLDKPAGLPVHAGPSGGDSVEARLPQLLGPRVQIRQPVHRLDADTSGCLLVATRRATLRALAAGFAARRVGKLYVAILDRPPVTARGHVDAPLRKVSSRARGWRMEIAASGESAVTDWVLLAERDGRALVALLPRTGRTHQLRVHAGEIAPGASIVGDRVYGARWPAGLMLHALVLAFRDPGSKELVIARSDWPARFAASGFPADAEVIAGLQPLLRSAASIASAMAEGSMR